MALSELTAAKLDHGLACLALDQLRGEAPPAGSVSPQDIAARAGLSEKTVRTIETMALAKIARALRHDLPPHLAKRLSRMLSNPRS